MKNLHIRIKVKWKEQGEDFRRADLLVKHFARILPKVLFRADIDPDLNRGCVDVAESNPEGFDSYILFLRYEVRLMDHDPDEEEQERRREELRREIDNALKDPPPDDKV